MFSSLKIREFRLFWSAMLVSLVGTWVQSMAQSWLAYRLTDSVFLLGLTGFLNYLPVSLFSLAAGVLVDRVVKRDLLLVTQLVFALLAGLMAFLVQRDAVTVPLVLGIAFLNGLVMAFDAPARQAMVVDLVGRPHLFNAIMLNSAAFNSARIIGPALAGVLIASVGMAGCFYVNAFSFLPVLAALFFITRHPVHPDAGRSSFRTDIAEGLALIRGSDLLWVLLVLVGVFSLLGASYIVLMPVFAHEVLGSGARGLAILMSSSGVGALAGVLSLGARKGSSSKFLLLRQMTVLFYASLIVFSFSRSLVFSAFTLMGAGFGGSASMSLVNTLLQTNIPDAYRGRTMGAFIMMFTGLLPFGNLLAGFLAHLLGAPLVVFFTAGACLVFYGFMDLRFLNARRPGELVGA
jgi:MFS family permease